MLKNFISLKCIKLTYLYSFPCRMAMPMRFSRNINLYLDPNVKNLKNFTFTNRTFLKLFICELYIYLIIENLFQVSTLWFLHQCCARVVRYPLGSHILYHHISRGIPEVLLVEEALQNSASTISNRLLQAVCNAQR